MMTAVHSVDVNVGDIYWDCSYHPVLCTEADYEDEVAGVSLFDGSSPRSCSIKHCGVEVLSIKQLQILLRMRDDFLLAERFFHSTQNREFYDILFAHLDNKTDFHK